LVQRFQLFCEKLGLRLLAIGILRLLVVLEVVDDQGIEVDLFVILAGGLILRWHKV
jgi:hypothetical protein